MRGPWSKKTPQRISITPVVDRTLAQELRKAKLVTIEAASEKTTVTRGG